MNDDEIIENRAKRRCVRDETPSDDNNHDGGDGSQLLNSHDNLDATKIVEPIESHLYDENYGLGPSKQPHVGDPGVCKVETNRPVVAAWNENDDDIDMVDTDYIDMEDKALVDVDDDSPDIIIGLNDMQVNATALSSTRPTSVLANRTNDIVATDSTKPAGKCSRTRSTNAQEMQRLTSLQYSKSGVEGKDIPSIENPPSLLECRQFRNDPHGHNVLEISDYPRDKIENWDNIKLFLRDTISKSDEWHKAATEISQLPGTEKVNIQTIQLPITVSPTGKVHGAIALNYETLQLSNGLAEDAYMRKVGSSRATHSLRNKNCPGGLLSKTWLTLDMAMSKDGGIGSCFCFDVTFCSLPYVRGKNAKVTDYYSPKNAKQLNKMYGDYLQEFLQGLHKVFGDDSLLIGSRETRKKLEKIMKKQNSSQLLEDVALSVRVSTPRTKGPNELMEYMGGYHPCIFYHYDKKVFYRTRWYAKVNDVLLSQFLHRREDTIQFFQNLVCDGKTLTKEMEMLIRSHMRKAARQSWETRRKNLSAAFSQALLLTKDLCEEEWNPMSPDDIVRLVSWQRFQCKGAQASREAFKAVKEGTATAEQRRIVEQRPIPLMKHRRVERKAFDAVNEGTATVKQCQFVELNRQARRKVQHIAHARKAAAQEGKCIMGYCKAQAVTGERHGYPQYCQSCWNAMGKSVPRPENKGWTHTKTARAKISAANKGRTPWNKGKQR